MNDALLIAKVLLKLASYWGLPFAAWCLWVRRADRKPKIAYTCSIMCSTEERDLSIRPGARWPSKQWVDTQEDVMDIQALVMDLDKQLRKLQQRLTALAADALQTKQPRCETEAA